MLATLAGAVMAYMPMAAGFGHPGRGACPYLGDQAANRDKALAL